MDPITLFLIVAVLMIVAFLLIPVPNSPAMEKASMDDFQFPTNSNSRAVPILYGTVWTFGNIIEYCCLQAREIKVCT